MKLSYEDIYAKCKEIKIQPGLKLYGVPRGGVVPAVILASLNQGTVVDSPETADLIVDDIIDSGKTKAGFDKPFIALYEKPTEWIEFPWEANELPAEDAVTRILQSMGEDISREGLRETPKRHIKYLREFLGETKFNVTTFEKESYDEMIIVKDINFYSLCEHHLLPFFGTACVAYVPNKKIVGLSKIPRIVDKFARRLQNQERITTQIADFIQKELNPKGVGVILKARHLCMEMRGVKKTAETTTSKLLGIFMENENSRSEFMRLAR